MAYFLKYKQYYKLLVVMLLFFSCASQTRLLDFNVKTPHKESKLQQINFVPMPRNLGLNAINGEVQFVPTAFKYFEKKIWVGGLFYNGATPLRSILITSNDGKNWKEESPSSNGVSIVAIQKGINGGVAVIEAFWSESSQHLEGGWISNKRRNSWRYFSMDRSSVITIDPIRKELGCCGEKINAFSIESDGWHLQIVGDNAVAEFVSKNQGLFWSMKKGTKKPLDDTVSLDNTWAITKSTAANIGTWYSLSEANIKIALPEAWICKIEGKFSTIRPKVVAGAAP